MFGYLNKILRINLTDQSIKDEKIGDSILKKYIGGQGLGTRILYDELKPDIDPLGPENKLIFMTGPLTGIVSSKFEVLAKSPLSKGIGDANSGGFWGPELKFAGYDGIIFEGVSPEPVYITIFDNNVKIESANVRKAKIWGKPVRKAVKTIIQKYRDPKIRVLAIGPGGENKVKFAAIMNEERAAARTGLGAVMGSKNVKAIAVRGTNTNKIEVRDAKKLKEKISQYFKNMMSDLTVQTFSTSGTPSGVNISSLVGDMPTKNWQLGVPEIDKIDANAVKNALSRTPTCWGCPIHCHRFLTTEINGVKYVGKGPEYETLAAFGSMLMINDLGTIIKANESCNNLGLDTISCGSLIAFAMEAFEKGILTEEEIGMDLSWGNKESTLKLIEKIAKRDGIGDILAEGVMRASEKIGNDSNKFALHVKGLEMPMHDPRAIFSMGLHYATDAVGSRHSSANQLIAMGLAAMGIPEIGIKRAPKRTKTKKQASATVKVQDLNTVSNSLVVCAFSTAGKAILDQVEIYNAITGSSLSIDDFLTIGERITNLRRAFNMKFGLTAKDDVLPPRMQESMPDGGSAGVVIDLKPMLDEYYQLRSWDPVTGKPLKEKLISLEMNDIAKDLWG
ncbi:MAG: aldehyde ferredoxin oxidoreductase family protein [Candidatus Helarchaeota archaeon]